MNQNGYYVRWEDNRKYITYTCPNGQKCRCKQLHEKKYTKEMMTLEFEIRLRELERIEQAGAENRKHGRTSDSNLLNSGRNSIKSAGLSNEGMATTIPERVPSLAENSAEGYTGDVLWNIYATSAQEMN